MKMFDSRQGVDALEQGSLLRRAWLICPARPSVKAAPFLLQGRRMV